MQGKIKPSELFQSPYIRIRAKVEMPGTTNGIPNIKEEDRLPFGKMVGNGMIIVSVGLIASGTLSIITYFTNNDFLSNVGMGVMVAFLIVGLLLCFYAINKYNKKK